MYTHRREGGANRGAVGTQKRRIPSLALARQPPFASITRREATFVSSQVISAGSMPSWLATGRLSRSISAEQVQIAPELIRACQHRWLEAGVASLLAVLPDGLEERGVRARGRLG
jgi:hypothetical protein